jgi:hypothetical protein
VSPKTFQIRAAGGHFNLQMGIELLYDADLLPLEVPAKIIASGLYIFGMPKMMMTNDYLA